MRTTKPISPRRVRDRVRTLEAARTLSLNGDYRAALQTVDDLLRQAPSDLEARRLRGNVLELAALDRAQYEAKRLLRFPQFLQARRCYEEILQADPLNTVAMIDLGDHFKNLAAFEQARSYYDAALATLKRGEYRLDWKDEVRSAYEGKIDIAQDQGCHDVAEALRVECDETLKLRTRRSPRRRRNR